MVVKAVWAMDATGKIKQRGTIVAWMMEHSYRGGGEGRLIGLGQRWKMSRL